MTSTTAAAAALALGEHLVHRPRGVVHLYRGGLTASGRYVPMTGRPACGQRTNRLQVLEPPTNPLDPAWTRRLCVRCEVILTPGPARATAADWDAWADGITLPELHASLVLADTVAEVDRVVQVALRTVGYPAMVRTPVGRGRLPLVQTIAARRLALDEEAAEARRHHDDTVRAYQARVEAAETYAEVVAAQNLAAATGNTVDRVRANRRAAAWTHRHHQPAAS
ncbi:hypothetical protein GCM10009737_07920 [Nocardioides lentus]|uniref:Uncharacterized protein n=1 Tax=Nocardioides lentus TaxID=338077 RepID=A0ABN2P0T8_9ACTN